MAQLTDLPSECLLQIVVLLRSSALLSLALTFNKRIFHIALPLLQPSIRERQNEKHILALFGADPPFLGGIGADIGFDKYGTTFSKFGPDSHAFEKAMDTRQLEYLDRHGDLNGDLFWLSDYCNKRDKSFSDYWKEEVTSEKVDTLIRNATRLGLTIPAGFERLLRSPDLYRFVHWPWHWSFELSTLQKLETPPLPNKKSPTINKFDAYMVQFHVERQRNASRELYLDTHGGSAVLYAGCGTGTYEDDDDVTESSIVHSPTLSDLDKELGVAAIRPRACEDLFLESTNFEKWLFSYATGMDSDLGSDNEDFWA